MQRDWATYVAILVFCGGGLGPRSAASPKIAVSEGYRHFGIIFWQFAIGGAVLAALNGGPAAAPCPASRAMSPSTRSSR